MTMAQTKSNREAVWPALPLEAWADTCATLHLWTQIVGKVRTALAPPVNHSWHVTLYVTAAGLTTSPIPYGERMFQVDFDFLRHELRIGSSDGGAESFPLAPQSVAAFYRRVMTALDRLGIRVKFHPVANEVPEEIRLDRDEAHAAYDAEYANRFWRVLVQADRVFKIFRARFIGKSSPVHFFWGAPDLAVTRFSGRPAPPHPGGVPHLPDSVAREAYSHEVSSAGFWPGAGLGYPAFYSYAYPEPAGYATAKVRPSAAHYNKDLREFVLPYDVVRQAASPDDALLEFLEATYEAAANLGRWDRTALERRP
jgi:hypothetical protein